MNCKFNRTKSNMAEAYGPEFNFTTDEIISIIRNTYQISTIGPGFNPIEVEVTLYNNDYYIRPGDVKNRFMEEFEKILSESNPLVKGLGFGDNMAYLCRIVQILVLIQKYFDESYFKEQIERRKQLIKNNVNKGELKYFLQKLNVEELRLFFSVMIEGRLEYGLFITEASSANLGRKIRESCRAVGANIPEDSNIQELIEFTENNRTYFFDILNCKVLANLLCDAIDLDITIATSAAQKLYNSGRSAMIEYIKCEVKNNI